MPFDGTPPSPDLSVPSLANLAYLLRHREKWPRDFEWDYRFVENCALGLADEMWPRWRVRFSVPERIYASGWRMMMPYFSRPESIAKAIERLVVKQKVRVTV